jgi:hypothetical protein
MKNIPILALVLTIAGASALCAATTDNLNKSQWVNMSDSDNTDPPEKGTWFMQMNGDIDSPTGHLADAFEQGWGGEISVGYGLPQGFEIGIELGFDTYPQKVGVSNATWNITPLVLKLGYVIGKGTLQPYFFLAGGLAFNSRFTGVGTLPGNSIEADFLGEAGLGLSFLLTGTSSVFLQTKMELDNTSAGYASDQPTLLIPINIGFKFPLN